MKKLLFLTLTISYALQAITPAGPYSPQTPVDIALEEIEFVNIPLGTESQEYVNRQSMMGLIAGAALGLSAYMLLPQSMKPQSSDTDELFAGIATGITGLATGLATYWYTTGCTSEKIEESKTNNLIYDHNKAVKALQLVNLSAHERARLSRLPFNNPTVDQDRLEVYPGILAETNIAPITCRVNYIKDLTAKLDHEEQSCTKLTATRIAQLRASSLVTNADQIAQTIEQQKEYIQALIALLPSQPMKNWCVYVEKHTPEFKAEQLQITFDTRYNQLRKDEENIKWYLARLAALQGHIFSHIDLSSSAWSFITAGLNTNYPNTPEGRQARKRDIKDTKNQISRLIQNYQNKIIGYNNDIIEHNELQSNVYSPIAQFVMSEGGNTRGLKGLKANKRLLEYNNYLNHSDGCIFWAWACSCFDN